MRGMTLFLMRRISLGDLRISFPEWKWSAARSGFGWAYEGELGDDKVRVEARASLFDEDGVNPPTWYVYQEEPPECLGTLSDWARARGDKR